MEKFIQITDTEYKLSEAKYLLRLLSRRSKRSTEFDFLLNAFVNSARSVIWVMRAEFSKIKGWSSWFEQKRVSGPEEKMFSLFNNLRVNSSKKSPIKTHFLVTIKIPKNFLTKDLKYRFRKLGNKKLKITIRENKKSGKPIIKLKSLTFSAYLESVERGVIGFTDKDILSLCKNYISTLDDIVKECIAKFRKYVKLGKNKVISHKLVKIRY